MKRVRAKIVRPVAAAVMAVVVAAAAVVVVVAATAVAAEAVGVVAAMEAVAVVAAVTAAVATSGLSSANQTSELQRGPDSFPGRVCICCCAVLGEVRRKISSHAFCGGGVAAGAAGRATNLGTRAGGPLSGAVP